MSEPIEHHIQHWDENDPTRCPNKSDALRTLHLCLNLIADSPPLALEGLKSASHEAQLDFWRAFICLDEETDFASMSLPDSNVEAWVKQLNDDGENAEVFYRRDCKEVDILAQVESHLEELSDAWQRGIIDERDGKGGTRSNRNNDILVALRKARKGGE